MKFKTKFPIGGLKGASPLKGVGGRSPQTAQVSISSPAGAKDNTSRPLGAGE